MEFQDYIIDAIDRVLSLDLPDDAIGPVVNDHARWMAHASYEDYCGVILR